MGGFWRPQAKRMTPMNLLIRAHHEMMSRMRDRMREDEGQMRDGMRDRMRDKNR